MSLLVLHHPYCKSLPCLDTFISNSNPKPSFKNLPFLTNYSFIPIFKYRNTKTHVLNCSNNNLVDETHQENEIEELGLLGKPSLSPLDIPSVENEYNNNDNKPDKDEVLEPFYKFFRDGKSLQDVSSEEEEEEVEEEEDNKVSIEYYDPKSGDFVVGVVVSGNEYKLDVNIGADLLGTMLTKEVLPLYDKELDNLLCDFDNVQDFMINGKMGVVKNEEALTGGLVAGQPVVDHGTILFAEVLGRTLSGRPLISTRRFFRRLAWHRVRQIKQLNEPIEVKITEWNTGGLLTRIEGLRAFLPKVELVNRVNNFTELKENVGRRIYVQITRINEDTNDLILSEKEAWNAIHLKEGTLLEGTVRKIFPYGAQIRIGESNRSGLLHISNITRGEIVSVSDVLALDEKVKVLVVKSMFPDKISLSTAELESEPGLILSNKEKVFLEAAEMAKKYRQKTPAIAATRKLEHSDALPFGDEESMYANWKWFKFEGDDEQSGQ